MQSGGELFLFVVGTTMVSEEAKRTAIRNYFTKFPKWTYLVIIIGVPLLLVGIGIILIIAGLIGIYFYMKQSKPTEEEIDEWLKEDIEKLKTKSLEKLGIDTKEIIGETLPIYAPILWSISGVDKKDLVFKKGKDGRTRFGIYSVTILQLTEKLIGTYQCTYNFLKNIPLNESTDEYFYKDIVTVSTSEVSTSYVLPNRQKLKYADAFVIKVSSGDAVEVILWNPDIEKYTGGKPKIMPLTMAETTISAIRKLLREKK